MATSRSEPRSVARPAWPVLLAGLLALLAVVTVLVGLLYERIGIGITTLVLLPVLVATITSLGPPRRAPGLAVIGGLAALWIWSLLSVGWSPLPDAANTAAGRWLLYAVLFSLLATLFQRREAATAFAGVATAGLGVFVVGILIASFTEGGSLYLEGRLNSPVGYVNGEAAVFAVGFWFAAGLAAHARPLVAAPAGALGAASLGLLLLTQSRAGIGSLLLTVLLVLLIAPGRIRFTVAVLAIALPVLPAAASLLDVTSDATNGVVADGAAADAALIVLACALAGGGLVLGAALAFARRGDRPLPPPSRRTLVAVGVALLVLGGGLAAGPLSGPISDRWDEFRTVENDSGGGNRLTTVGGARYDYWRVALRAFEDDPLAGVGSGGYRVPYLLLRRTDQVVRQPHSLPLQVAAETGVVGLAALLAVLGGALLALAHGMRHAATHRRDRWLVVSAAGTAVGWTLHTATDWLHLLPGLVAIVLAAIAILAAVDGWDDDRPPPLPKPASKRRLLLGLGVVGAALVAFGAASVARVTIADLYRESAQGALPGDPDTTISRARETIELNGDDTGAHFVEASAWALRNDYARARGALLEAQEIAPGDYVTYVLLGDLAARRGDTAEALRQYEAALARNPRDAEIAALVADLDR
ncbi:MAG: O-antigen ligase family protein [Solirubrobacteraceae bacterium]